MKLSVSHRRFRPIVAATTFVAMTVVGVSVATAMSGEEYESFIKGYGKYNLVGVEYDIEQLSTLAATYDGVPILAAGTSVDSCPNFWLAILYLRRFEANKSPEDLDKASTASDKALALKGDSLQKCQTQFQIYAKTRFSESATRIKALKTDIATREADKSRGVLLTFCTDNTELLELKVNEAQKTECAGASTAANPAALKNDIEQRLTTQSWKWLTGNLGGLPDVQLSRSAPKTLAELNQALRNEVARRSKAWNQAASRSTVSDATQEDLKAVQRLAAAHTDFLPPEVRQNLATYATAIDSWDAGSSFDAKKFEQFAQLYPKLSERLDWIDDTFPTVRSRAENKLNDLWRPIQEAAGKCNNVRVLRTIIPTGVQAPDGFARWTDFCDQQANLELPQRLEARVDRVLRVESSLHPRGQDYDDVLLTQVRQTLTHYAAANRRFCEALPDVATNLRAVESTVATHLTADNLRSLRDVTDRCREGKKYPYQDALRAARSLLDQQSDQIIANCAGKSDLESKQSSVSALLDQGESAIDAQGVGRLSALRSSIRTTAECAKAPQGPPSAGGGDVKSVIKAASERVDALTKSNMFPVSIVGELRKRLTDTSEGLGKLENQDYPNLPEEAASAEWSKAVSDWVVAFKRIHDPSELGSLGENASRVCVAAGLMEVAGLFDRSDWSGAQRTLVTLRRDCAASKEPAERDRLEYFVAYAQWKESPDFKPATTLKPFGYDESFDRFLAR